VPQRAGMFPECPSGLLDYQAVCCREAHEEGGRWWWRCLDRDGHRVGVVAGGVDAALDDEPVTLVESLRVLVRLCDKKDALRAQL
jgi:hypothetical protein